jgi:hypothetical protein
VSGLCLNNSGIYNLTRLTRKSVFVLTAVCFAALATGLTLQLHMISCEHPEGHDFEQCPVCQQLTALGKFYSGPQLTLDNPYQFEFSIELSPDTLIILSQPKPFDSRPPPSVI